jgi:hypothetical protein
MKPSYDTVFRTADGKVHDTEPQAIAHAKALAVLDELSSFLDARGVTYPTEIAEELVLNRIAIVRLLTGDLIPKLANVTKVLANASNKHSQSLSALLTAAEEYGA